MYTVLWWLYVRPYCIQTMNLQNLNLYVGWSAWICFWQGEESHCRILLLLWLHFNFKVFTTSNLDNCFLFSLPKNCLCSIYVLIQGVTGLFPHFNASCESPAWTTFFTCCLYHDNWKFWISFGFIWHNCKLHCVLSQVLCVQNVLFFQLCVDAIKLIICSFARFDQVGTEDNEYFVHLL